ncbi:MAG: acetyl-CoA carboxylase carboxyltransferase subunit alpha [Candidatus Krumholzibacteriia bacterium]
MDWSKKGPWLDFERPLVELEERIRTLQDSAVVRGLDVGDEVERLRRRVEQLGREIFANLDPWQRVQLARHPRRPTTLDYIRYVFDSFVELHGDRLFRDDPAIVGGLAALGERRLLVIGHQKGRDTKSNILRNFGMAHPEGYRKALRLMELAARHGRPVVTFIDTPGAYPGIGAEERGQAEAIARNLREMASLPVPILAFVTGEGGSGGALAIGVADRVTMLENAIYSVISPEGCAAILWRDRAKAPEAARAMKITAADALGLGVIDRILPEPLGGAHRDHAGAAALIRQAIVDELPGLESRSPATLLDDRLQKFLGMGIYAEEPPAE